jgi:hypothetical protein
MVPPGPRGCPVLGNALQLRDKTRMFGRGCPSPKRFVPTLFSGVTSGGPSYVLCKM